MFDVEKALQLQAGIVDIVSCRFPKTVGHEVAVVLEYGSVVLIANLTRKLYREHDAAFRALFALMTKHNKVYKTKREVSIGIASTSVLFRVEDFVICAMQLWHMHSKKLMFMTQAYHPDLEDCDPIWPNDKIHR